MVSINLITLNYGRFSQNFQKESKMILNKMSTPNNTTNNYTTRNNTNSNNTNRNYTGGSSMTNNTTNNTTSNTTNNTTSNMMSSKRLNKNRLKKREEKRKKKEKKRKSKVNIKKMIMILNNLIIDYIYLFFLFMGNNESTQEGYGYQVIEIKANSPVEKAGLEIFLDFIIGV